MTLRHAVILVFVVFLTLNRVSWIAASDMGAYHKWTTVAWLIAGMAAITVLLFRYDKTR